MLTPGHDPHGRARIQCPQLLSWLLRQHANEWLNGQAVKHLHMLAARVAGANLQKYTAKSLRIAVAFLSRDAQAWMSCTYQVNTG